MYVYVCARVHTHGCFALQGVAGGAAGLGMVPRGANVVRGRAHAAPGRGVMPNGAREVPWPAATLGIRTTCCQ